MKRALIMHHEQTQWQCDFKKFENINSKFENIKNQNGFQISNLPVYNSQ